jgi:hypothetical protein
VGSLGFVPHDAKINGYHLTLLVSQTTLPDVMGHCIQSSASASCITFFEFRHTISNQTRYRFVFPTRWDSYGVSFIRNVETRLFTMITEIYDEVEVSFSNKTKEKRFTFTPLQHTFSGFSNRETQDLLFKWYSRIIKGDARPRLLEAIYL